MSFIQIACAVLVPLLWGYQFVAIKVGVVQFPPLFFLGLRFLAIALLLIPFVNIIVLILVYIAFARNFGKGVGFAIGMVILPFIFFPVLAFSDAKYQPVAA